jgi:hypothetical protein
LHDRSESLFAIYGKTILQEHDPKKSGKKVFRGDRAQTYNVQQQFGRWA